MDSRLVEGMPWPVDKLPGHEYLLCIEMKCSRMEINQVNYIHSFLELDVNLITINK